MTKISKEARLRLRRDPDALELGPEAPAKLHTRRSSEHIVYNESKGRIEGMPIVLDDETEEKTNDMPREDKATTRVASPTFERIGAKLKEV